MRLQVVSTHEGHRLRQVGDAEAGVDVVMVNAFLTHLGVRCWASWCMRTCRRPDEPEEQGPQMNLALPAN